MAFEYLNAFLTALLAFGTFAIGVATWQTTERQADVAEALRDLEFAKSQPKFEVSSSEAVRTFKTGLSDRVVVLPRSITVQIRENAREVKFVDVPVAITLLDSKDEQVCSVEVRGLYLDEGQGKPELWSEPAKDLEPFLTMLEAWGLNVLASEPYVRVTYIDIFGRTTVTHLHLNGSEFVGAETGMPIYSGIWSNGHGFFSDEGDPEKYCPQVSDQLRAAIREAGGKSGPAL